MSKMSELVALAEEAMLGRVVEINSYAEADLIAEYIADATLGLDKKFDFETQVNKYNRSKTKNEIIGLAVTYAWDMVIVDLVLKNDSKGDYRIVPYEFSNGNITYSLCWGENLACDYLSELGDVAFKKVNDCYVVA